MKENIITVLSKYIDILIFVNIYNFEMVAECPLFKRSFAIRVVPRRKMSVREMKGKENKKNISEVERKTKMNYGEIMQQNKNTEENF